MNLIVRWTKAFGLFWWDFRVGDTPELFVGMLVVVGIAFVTHNHRALAVTLVPLSAICVLLASTVRGRKRS